MNREVRSGSYVSCLMGAHHRAPGDKRGELELCLRDAFAAGCEAAQSRSLVTAAVYAEREAPIVSARINAEKKAKRKPRPFKWPKGAPEDGR